MIEVMVVASGWFGFSVYFVVFNGVKYLFVGTKKKPRQEVMAVVLSVQFHSNTLDFFNKSVVKLALSED